MRSFRVGDEIEWNNGGDLYARLKFIRIGDSSCDLKVLKQKNYHALVGHVFMKHSMVISEEWKKVDSKFAKYRERLLSV
jgi:plasmid maintenance system killer protein